MEEAPPFEVCGLLVPENLAGPIPEILAGFRKEDRDEEDPREDLHMSGAGASGGLVFL